MSGFFTYKLPLFVSLRSSVTSGCPRRVWRSSCCFVSWFRRFSRGSAATRTTCETRSVDLRNVPSLVLELEMHGSSLRTVKKPSLRPVERNVSWRPEWPLHCWAVFSGYNLMKLPVDDLLKLNPLSVLVRARLHCPVKRVERSIVLETSVCWRFLE